MSVAVAGRQTANQDDEMESELFYFVYLLKVSGTICIAGEFCINQGIKRTNYRYYLLYVVVM